MSVEDFGVVIHEEGSRVVQRSFEQLADVADRTERSVVQLQEALAAMSGRVTDIRIGSQFRVLSDEVNRSKLAVANLKKELDYVLQLKPAPWRNPLGFDEASLHKLTSSLNTSVQIVERNLDRLTGRFSEVRAAAQFPITGYQVPGGPPTLAAAIQAHAPWPKSVLSSRPETDSSFRHVVAIPLAPRRHPPEPFPLTSKFWGKPSTTEAVPEYPSHPTGGQGQLSFMAGLGTQTQFSVPGIQEAMKQVENLSTEFARLETRMVEVNSTARQLSFNIPGMGSQLPLISGDDLPAQARGWSERGGPWGRFWNEGHPRGAPVLNSRDNAYLASFWRDRNRMGAYGPGNFRNVQLENIVTTPNSIQYEGIEQERRALLERERAVQASFRPPVQGQLGFMVTETPNTQFKLPGMQQAVNDANTLNESLSRLETTVRQIQTPDTQLGFNVRGMNEVLDADTHVRQMADHYRQMGLSSEAATREARANFTAMGGDLGAVSPKIQRLIEEFNAMGVSSLKATRAAYEGSQSLIRGFDQAGTSVEQYIAKLKQENEFLNKPYAERQRISLRDEEDQAVRNVAKATGVQRLTPAQEVDVRGLIQQNQFLRETARYEDQIHAKRADAIPTARLDAYNRALREGVITQREYDTALKKNVATQERVKESVERSHTTIAGFTRQLWYLRLALDMVAGFLFIRELKQYTDSWINLHNTVKMSTGTVREAAAVEERLYKMVVSTRQPIEDLQTVYRRTALASNSLGISQEDALKGTEAVGFALTAQGATAEQAKGSLLQWGQMLGMGKIRMQEFTSISENMPVLLLEIAKNIDTLAVPSMGRFRRALEEQNRRGGGKIDVHNIVEKLGIGNTELDASIIFKALLKSYDKLKEMSDKAIPTIDQGFNILHGAMVRYVGDLNQSYGISTKFNEILLWISKHLSVLAITIGTFATFAGIVSLPIIGKALGNLIGRFETTTSAAKGLIGVFTTFPVTSWAAVILAATFAVWRFRDSIKIGSEGLTLGDWLTGLFTRIGDILDSVWEKIKGIFVDTKNLTNTAEGLKAPTRSLSYEKPLELIQSVPSASGRPGGYIEGLKVEYRDPELTKFINQRAKELDINQNYIASHMQIESNFGDQRPKFQIGQEVTYKDGTKDRAYGNFQIMQRTEDLLNEQLKKTGEQREPFNRLNKFDNAEMALRLIDEGLTRYSGDFQKEAVNYYSGPHHGKGEEQLRVSLEDANTAADQVFEHIKDVSTKKYFNDITAIYNERTIKSGMWTPVESVAANRAYYPERSIQIPRPAAYVQTSYGPEAYTQTGKSSPLGITEDTKASVRNLKKEIADLFEGSGTWWTNLGRAVYNALHGAFVGGIEVFFLLIPTVVKWINAKLGDLGHWIAEKSIEGINWLIDKINELPAIVVNLFNKIITSIMKVVVEGINWLFSQINKLPDFMLKPFGGPLKMLEGPTEKPVSTATFGIPRLPALTPEASKSDAALKEVIAALDQISKDLHQDWIGVMTEALKSEGKKIKTAAETQKTIRTVETRVQGGGISTERPTIDFNADRILAHYKEIQDILNGIADNTDPITKATRRWREELDAVKFAYSNIDILIPANIKSRNASPSGVGEYDKLLKSMGVEYGPKHQGVSPDILGYRIDPTVRSKLDEQINRSNYEAIHPYESTIGKLTDELQVEQQVIEVRKESAKVLQTINDLKKKGITPTAAQEVEIRVRIHAINTARDLSNIIDSVTAPRRELREGLENVPAARAKYEEDLKKQVEATANPEIMAAKAAAGIDTSYYMTSMEQVKEAMKDFDEATVQMEMHWRIQAGEGTFLDGLIEKFDILDKKSRNWALQFGAILGTVVRSAIDGMSDALAKATVDTMTLGAAFKNVREAIGNLAREILTTLISSIIKMGVQWSLSQIVPKTVQDMLNMGGSNKTPDLNNVIEKSGIGPSSAAASLNLDNLNSSVLTVTGSLNQFNGSLQTASATLSSTPATTSTGAITTGPQAYTGSYAGQLSNQSVINTNNYSAEEMGLNNTSNLITSGQFIENQRRLTVPFPAETATNLPEVSEFRTHTIKLVDSMDQQAEAFKKATTATSSFTTVETDVASSLQSVTTQWKDMSVPSALENQQGAGVLGVSTEATGLSTSLEMLNTTATTATTAVNSLSVAAETTSSNLSVAQGYSATALQGLDSSASTATIGLVQFNTALNTDTAALATHSATASTSSLASVGTTTTQLTSGLGYGPLAGLGYGPSSMGYAPEASTVAGYGATQMGYGAGAAAATSTALDSSTYGAVEMGLASKSAAQSLGGLNSASGAAAGSLGYLSVAMAAFSLTQMAQSKGFNPTGGPGKGPIGQTSTTIATMMPMGWMAGLGGKKSWWKKGWNAVNPFTWPRDIFGLESGGWTGNVGKKDVAGVVHGQEFVVKAGPATEHRQLLEKINSGKLFSNGGWTGAIPKNSVAGAVHGQEFVIKAGPAAENRQLLETINSGFDKGGWTGTIPKDKVAGAVHGQEFVVKAGPATEHRSLLEAINNGSGFADGGWTGGWASYTPISALGPAETAKNLAMLRDLYRGVPAHGQTGSNGKAGSPGMQVTVHNYTGARITTEQISPSEIRIIAGEEARKAVHREAPGVIAADMRDPNSRTSRALNQNTMVTRRNG